MIVSSMVVKIAGKRRQFDACHPDEPNYQGALICSAMASPSSGALTWARLIAFVSTRLRTGCSLAGSESCGTHPVGNAVADAGMMAVGWGMNAVVDR